MERTITCICCPLGCQITVGMSGGEIIDISGNSCIRGENYACREITAPVRTVTSTVKVTGGTAPVVSVKTRNEIPKNKIFDCIHCIKKISAEAPIQIGDVLLHNAAGTGVDIIATKEIPRA